MARRKNIVMVSLDEVRNDNLSCNGYEKMRTENIDRIAGEGVVFEKAIAAGCMTPVCLSSVLCAQYPNKHTLRQPLCRIQSKTAAAILRENGYKTCFFTGNGLIGARHGFDAGYDDFFEPKEAEYTTWNPTGKDEDVFYEGWWWVDDFLQWLRDNHQSAPFFIWGHFYETHEGGEFPLLKKGRIQEGVLSEMRYKDARIKVADEQLIGGLIRTFDELGLWDTTLLVLFSDHGTGVGEHPVKPIPHRSGGLLYPQHRSMYDHDINVFLIMRDSDLPKGKRIPGVVRSVDIMPTVLDHVGISVEEAWDFDGISLLPIVERGKAGGLQAYTEDLYEYRSDYTDVEPNLLVGSLQSVRTDDCKLIRNLTRGTEEYYDLRQDPGEQKDLIDEVREKQEVVELRRSLNSKLLDARPMDYPFSEDESKAIKERMRRLGYLV
ncbi:MAG: sulfatase [Spirochaetales bacterium]|nr:sulfatase [Spirochaetales bacterium]